MTTSAAFGDPQLTASYREGQRCEAFWATFWQKYLSWVALALPVSYPMMGWQTTGKASATRTEAVQKCFTAFREAV
jgi:hypothetical protein